MTQKKWLFFPPVLAGVAGLLLLKAGHTPPEQSPVTEAPRAVRVIAAPSVNLIPVVRSHGNVEPGDVWEAVAQVAGRIVDRHPALEKGSLLDAQTLLIRIDPTDYELSLARNEADIQAARAQFQELEARETNTRASLDIEEDALRLTQAELDRKSRLVDNGNLSRSELDKERRTLLAQQQSVRNLANTLNLIPSQRALLDAQLLQAQRRLDGARLDLERTEIRLPFRGRISAVNVEKDQYVRQGDRLASADSIHLAEVAAQIPIARMAGLIRSSSRLDLSSGSADRIRDQLGISARIHLKLGDRRVSWDARFSRMSDTIDPRTRTVGVIVAVEGPYADVQPGVRPPLVKGMFVEVELRGMPRPGSLVIPREALHGDRVYVVDGERRLEIRPVEVDLEQPELVGISSGLKPGELVLLSDPVPAIAGMLLEPQRDAGALARLLESAGAGKAVP